MAFDPQDHFPDLETDIATVQANHLDAALFAGAVACIDQGIAEWYVHDVMPSAEVFDQVEEFANNEDPVDPETGATFLLFVREAVRP